MFTCIMKLNLFYFYHLSAHDFVSGPFTALIPTDAAFAKIPAADLAAVGANTQTLTNVLQYHLINGDIFTWDLKTNELLTSLNGHVVRVYTRNGVSLILPFSFNIRSTHEETQWAFGAKIT